MEVVGLSELPELGRLGTAGEGRWWGFGRGAFEFALLRRMPPRNGNGRSEDVEGRDSAVTGEGGMLMNEVAGEVEGSWAGG